MTTELILTRSPSCVLLIALLLACSSIYGQKRRVGASARGRPATIRSVDFLNREYTADCVDESKKVRVVNGKYAPPSDTDGPFYELHVKVTYGDLTGDGQEEAVVIKTCDGAVGSYEDGTIYTLRQGRLTPLANIEYGNRGDGGDIVVKIAGGLLSVERNVGQAACCAELRKTVRYRLVGRTLRQVGKAVHRPLEPESKPTVQRIEFAPGRNSATIEGTLEPYKRAEYLLRASKGQKLDVKLVEGVRGASAEMIVIDGEGTLVGAETRYGNQWQGLLPATGEYKILVENKANTSQSPASRYTLEVSIR